MVDVISLVVGFALGVVLVGVALEIGMKRSSRTIPASKHTKKWNISEISNPKIMAEYLSNVDIPKNSKVLFNKVKNKDVLTGVNAKEHSSIKGNFIVGDDRALILSGPVNKDEIGFWTVEKEIVRQLNEEFDAMWAECSKMKLEEEK